MVSLKPPEMFLCSLKLSHLSHPTWSEKGMESGVHSAPVLEGQSNVMAHVPSPALALGALGLPVTPWLHPQDSLPPWV